MFFSFHKKKCTFNEKRFSCDDCLGLLFSLTRPPTCGGCFTLQRTWQKARETPIRTVRLLHVCDKKYRFHRFLLLFLLEGPNFKKTQESKNGFPQDSKNKEKTNKTHAQGEDQRQSHPVGRNRGAAASAHLLRGGAPPEGRRTPFKGRRTT